MTQLIKQTSFGTDGMMVSTALRELPPYSRENMYETLVFDKDGKEIDGSRYLTKPASLKGHSYYVKKWGAK